MRKYVAALEDKGLIRTEQTSIYTKTGRKQNGSLLYNIRPIQEAIDIFNARQLYRLEADAARQRAAKKLAKLDPVSPCEPLCAALEAEPSPSPTEGSLDEIEPLSGEDTRTTGFPPKPAKRVRWEKEEQRSERFFAIHGENERYGACDDAKQDKEQASQAPPTHPLLPAVRAVAGFFTRGLVREKSSRERSCMRETPVFRRFQRGSYVEMEDL